MATKPKYFCENCGSEVAANARLCPKCGKFFSSVRCPQCGHLGTVHDFKNGCPACHYAMTKEEIYGTPEPEAAPNAKKRPAARRKAGKRAAVAVPARSPSAIADEAMPGWMYAASLAVLVFVLVLVIFRCQ